MSEVLKLNPAMPMPEVKRGRGRPRKTTEKTVAKPAAKRNNKVVEAVAITTRVNPAAIFMGVVTIGLLAVSLSHLATGMEMLTQCESWQAWAMSIGIDAMLVATEYMVMTATPDVKQQIHHAATFQMALTLTLSAYLNALAFSGGHWDIDHAPAIAVGCFVPIAVAVATFMLSKGSR